MALCPDCGKSKAATRAGSITSYFFQEKYCNCHSNGKSSHASRRATIIESNNRICTNCGKSSPKDQKAGSFTAYLFKELRCQCLNPQFRIPQFEDSASIIEHEHTGTAERANYRRTLAKSFKAEASNQTGKAIGPGAVIGGTFKIESVIGEGGMGTVYLAEHLAMRRQYALKILLPSMVSEKHLIRFQAEAKTLATLNHPSLVNVYDLGIHEQSVFYYSMDYLTGRNLENLLVEEGPLTLARTIDTFLPVLDGLAYAHSHGIVHRDIKPANIFICTPGGAEVKILDFGIAKLVNADNLQQLTAAGEIFGSPFYMSPEQCLGDEIDARSDIYSVGCAMYECLTGYVPFEASSSVEIAMLHQEKEPPSLASASKREFPQSIEMVLAKCLAKLPERRYQSAGELMADLERVKDGKAIIIYERKIASEPPDNYDNEDDSEDNNADYQDKNKSKAPLMAAIAIIITCLSSIPAWFFFASDGEKPEGPSTVESEPAKIASAQPDFKERPADYQVKPFLDSNPDEYSKIITIAGQKLKLFSFPRFCIGNLSVWKNGVKIDTLLAQGDCKVPSGHVLRLEANKFVSDHPQLLKYFKSDDLYAINFLDSNANSSSSLPYIAKLTALQSVSITVATLTDRDVAYLNQLKKLQDLNLTVTGAGTGALTKLELLPQLLWFSLSCAGKVSPIFEKLAHNDNLMHLNLRRMMLKEKDFDAIASCKNIQRLVLVNVPITIADLAKLTALKRLNYLQISNCPSLDASCLDSLKKFKKLEYLTLPPGLLNAAQEQELARALPKLKGQAPR